MKPLIGSVALIAVAITWALMLPPKTIAVTGDLSAITPTIAALIQCESQGVNVARIDSNGKMSYGILQFQEATWLDWEASSGIHGSPMDEGTAIAMANWAIAHGLLGHWTCAHLRHLVR